MPGRVVGGGMAGAPRAIRDAPSWSALNWQCLVIFSPLVRPVHRSRAGRVRNCWPVRRVLPSSGYCNRRSWLLAPICRSPGSRHRARLPWARPPLGSFVFGAPSDLPDGPPRVTWRCSAPGHPGFSPASRGRASTAPWVRITRRSATGRAPFPHLRQPLARRAPRRWRATVRDPGAGPSPFPPLAGTDHLAICRRLRIGCPDLPGPTSTAGRSRKP